jgi:hypothetical protein
MDGRDVFISFNEHDTAIAEALADALTEHGVSSWLFTRENPKAPGISHLTQSHGGISGCRAVVLLASPTSIHSSEVAIEMQQAHAQRKPVIIVRVNMTQNQLREAIADIAMVAGTRTTLEMTPRTVKATADLIAHSPQLKRPTGTVSTRPSAGASSVAADNPFRGLVDDPGEEPATARYSKFHVHIRAASSREAQNLSQQIRKVLVDQGFQVTVSSGPLLDPEGTFELFHPWLGIGTAMELQRLLDGVTWRGKRMSARRYKDEGTYDQSRQSNSFEIVVA